MKAWEVLAVAAVLTACSIVDPNYIAAEGRALSAGAQPGTGYIRSVAVVPGGHPDESASTGASGPAARDRNAYRLYVDMDNGRTQTVDVDSGRFMSGQRVELSANGRVVGF